MAKKTTRREFLKGRSASDAMADMIDHAIPSDRSSTDPTDPAVGSYLLEVGRRAMACQFEVYLNAGQYENATEVALGSLELLEPLEKQMSIFQEDSLITHINRTAAERPVKVESGLFSVLELASRLNVESGGAFDITAGPLSEVWGFSRRKGTIPSEDDLQEAIKNVGGDLIKLDPKEHTIQFKRPGVRINLGAIGKGYALDRCADALTVGMVNDFLFHGGQSSVVAQGSTSHDSEIWPDGKSGGWAVGVVHPLRPSQRLATIRLKNRALATSGSARQFFRHKGQRYSHVLDPRTGRPAEGVLSATVVAPTAALADALSTAFFVMGTGSAFDYCRKHPEIAVLFVCPTRARGGEIKSYGLQREDLKILSR